MGWGPGHHIAYLRVHSRASSLYFSRSVLYILAISGTRGSSGLGSHKSEQIDNSTEKENFALTKYLKTLFLNQSRLIVEQNNLSIIFQN